MKVLQFNKIYFAIVGIRPFERIKNPYDESVRSYIFWLIVINSGAVVAFCGAYLYKNFVDFSQLSGMIISFMLIFTTLAATGSYLSIAMNKEKSENLNDELQDIVDKSKGKGWKQTRTFHKSIFVEFSFSFSWGSDNIRGLWKNRKKVSLSHKMDSNCECNYCHYFLSTIPHPFLRLHVVRKFRNQYMVPGSTDVRPIRYVQRFWVVYASCVTSHLKRYFWRHDWIHSDLLHLLLLVHGASSRSFQIDFEKNWCKRLLHWYQIHEENGGRPCIFRGIDFAPHENSRVSTENLF